MTLASSVPAAAVTANDRERELLAEMNRVRAKHGLRPLQIDARLQQAARSHSHDMIRRTYFAHGSLVDRLRRFEFRLEGRTVGENLAWGAGRLGTPGSIVAAWLQSPAHRRTLLRPGFSQVGVGAITAPFQGAREATVVTANFATG